MTDAISSPEQIIQIVNTALQNRKSSVVNILNDKLTLSVFSELERNLHSVQEINLIIREGSTNTNRKELVQEFEITTSPSDVFLNNYEITQKNKLRYFHKARLMHDFIASHVNVKKIISPEMVKGNILIIDDDIQIQGTSSLEINRPKTVRGLPQIHFDTFINSSMDTDQIRRSLKLFNELWNNRGYSIDYKEELLEGLRYIYKDYSPEFLYYFTINTLFGHQLDSSFEHLESDSSRFKKTRIWNALYNFQKDAVASGIQKINRHNGCILADSVGLGKTYEALAIIKFFEMRNDNVLVLAPAKLYDNWDSFRSPYVDNPLAEDRLNYKILSHTDLSRKKGMSRSGLDLSRVDWGSFDLLVIDESHNFRNRIESKDHITRYHKLISDIIQKGTNTKVLLLSATPVNNSLRDLRNQISIITSDRDSAFEEEGIPSIQQLLINAQKEINEWSDSSRNNKLALLDKLPSEFYKLLEMITISRSRKHITRYYGSGDFGVFPKKLKPIVFRPEIDSNGILLKFSDVNDELETLILSVYSPMAYILPQYKEMYREKYATKVDGRRLFDHEQREAINVKLHRFNLCKRLESSVYSFGTTVERLLGRIDSYISALSSDRMNVSTDEDIDDEDDFFLDYKYDIDVRHLDVRNYLEDLEYDKNKLVNIQTQIKLILDKQRDLKLHELSTFTKEKIQGTPYNSGNKKVLIFSAFADTANYLYDSLSPMLKENGIHTAVVTGSDKPRTTLKGVNLQFNEVLSLFSPRSKGQTDVSERTIDVLIATDCISEGQNLQDCDCVVNYDIQWNPVVLIQRFGRIDRLGSQNPHIQMVNFFPNMELNEYLQLEERVKRKMVAANIGSTGDEDLLSPDMNDLEFRRTQLERIQKDVVELEEMGDTLSLTDLNMNDYLNELYDYIKAHPEIKQVPAGVFSITKGTEKGCLFCFRHSEEQIKPKSDSSLYPYYLMYIKNSGEVYIGMHNAREALAEFRRLSYGNSEPDQALVRQFKAKTRDAEDMAKYSKMITKAITAITGAERRRAEESIFDFTGYNDDFSQTVEDDFELISFLIVE